MEKFEQTITDIADKLEDWNQAAADPEMTKEKLRGGFGSIVFRTLAFVVVAFVICGCVVPFAHDAETTRSFLEIVGAVSAIIGPITGFVSGYYFSNKV